MTFAADGIISQAPILGGIEISDAEFQWALEGMLEGKEVKIVDGAITLVTPPEPEDIEEPEGSVIVEDPYLRLTPLELLDLFTEDEQLAVVSATMQDAAVKLWYDRLIAATFVTYEDPRTENGLQALVEAQLLTQERKDEIVKAMHREQEQEQGQEPDEEQEEVRDE